MRQFYKQIEEGEDRTYYIFGYKKIKSSQPNAKSWQALYTWHFSPIKSRVILLYLNLMPQRVRPLVGLKYAKVQY